MELLLTPRCLTEIVIYFSFVKLCMVHSAWLHDTDCFNRNSLTPTARQLNIMVEFL